MQAAGDLTRPPWPTGTHLSVSRAADPAWGGRQLMGPKLSLLHALATLLSRQALYLCHAIAGTRHLMAP